MRKDFGKKAIITPLPVLIIATYNEDGSANAMNAAWGGQREDDQITICLGTSHKTVENLKKTQSFYRELRHSPNRSRLRLLRYRQRQKVAEQGGKIWTARYEKCKRGRSDVRRISADSRMHDS